MDESREPAALNSPPSTSPRCLALGIEEGDEVCKVPMNYGTPLASSARRPSPRDSSNRPCEPRALARFQTHESRGFDAFCGQVLGSPRVNPAPAWGFRVK